MRYLAASAVAGAFGAFGYNLWSGIRKVDIEAAVIQCNLKLSEFGVASNLRQSQLEARVAKIEAGPPKDFIFEIRKQEMGLWRADLQKLRGQVKDLEILKAVEELMQNLDKRGREAHILD